MTRNHMPARMIFLMMSLVVAGMAVKMRAGQAAVSVLETEVDRVAVSPSDIGGVVNGPNGPEAGVWVIAESSQLPTKFRKIVVTDDEGRFLVPDLPKASYRVWVRGYGLLDSAPVESALGRKLVLGAALRRMHGRRRRSTPQLLVFAHTCPAAVRFSYAKDGSSFAASVRTCAKWSEECAVGGDP
jgi:hypothetical protein